MNVDHSHLPVNLGVPEAAGSADAKLVPSTKETSSPLPHMPFDGNVGLTRKAKAEVFGPPRQESVEPGLQLRPGCRVSPVQQGVDLLLEPLLGLLRGLSRKQSPSGPPMPSWAKGIAQEVERLFSGVTEARFGGVDRQAELLQPVRHQRQALFRLTATRTDNDEVIGIGDDLPQPFARSRLPPVAQKAVDVDVGQQR